MFIPPFYCGVAVGFIGCLVLMVAMAVLIGSDTGKDEEEQ